MCNKQTVDLVKHYEGCHLQAYICPTGHPTIGYGFTRNVKMGDEWTHAQAEESLVEELTITGRYIRENLKDAKIEPNHCQVGAFVSLAYNIGFTGWLNSTARRRFIDGDIAGAGQAILMWNKGTVNGEKVVLKGLQRRRLSELELFNCLNAQLNQECPACGV